VLSRPIGDPEVSDELLNGLAVVFAEEVDRIRAFTGKEFRGWDRITTTVESQ
jgi:hypothetical protein